MSNPFSPLLAEILMDDIEKNIHENTLTKNFIHWYRVVNGFLVGTPRQFNALLNLQITYIQKHDGLKQNQLNQLATAHKSVGACHLSMD